MRQKAKMIALSTVAMLGLTDSSTVWAQGRNDVIVQSGQTTPVNTGNFSTFETPLLNNLGQVAFESNLLNTNGGFGDDNGIFRGTGGFINRIVTEGNQAQSNGTYSSFSDYQLNHSGQVAFFAGLSGTTGGPADNSGIFIGSGFSPIQIVREGQAAPTGFGTNGVFSVFSAGFLSLNDVGQVAFRADLTGTTGTTTDNQGVFRGSGGAITQIARKGQSALGNGTFNVFNDVLLNNNGQTAFRADLIGTNNGSADNQGIFIGNGGTLTQIVREGGSAPINGQFGTFSRPDLNDEGQVAFSANLTGTSGGTSDNSGIFRGSGGAITQIVRKGQAAPDGNGNFSFTTTNQHSLNNAGQVSFYADFTDTIGGTAGNSGIFVGSGGTITQIARAGQAAPDGNGILLGPSFFLGFGSNESGQTAFTANIGGPGFTVPEEAILIGDGIDLVQVVRQYDTINGNVINDINYDPAGLNDLGQIAYTATFQNGSSSIIRWTPELHWRSTFSSNWDSTSRWTLGLNPGSPHDVFIDPAASLTVTGPAANTTVRSLQIGGGTGLATLDLRNGSVLTATSGVTIASTGLLTGDGSIAGNVVNNGNILADNITVSGTLTNNSVIEGSGRIHANLVNGASGEIRALSGNTMRLTGGSFSNSGLVEAHGGELRVTSNLQNNSGSGLISMRDGSLIANAGINNAGSIAFSQGSSTLRGDLNNVGLIQVSGGANATFFDDVVQNGTMQVASVGNTNSSAVILGSFTGSGGFVGGGDVFALGDLRPGNSPSVVTYGGNLFMGASTHTFIELAGLALGEFDKMIVTGDLNLAGSLSVSLIDGHVMGAGQQYLIGEVGGNLAGQFNGLGEGALVGVFSGYQTFISYTAGDGNDIALVTAIPEPSTAMVLALIGTVVVLRRRREA